MIQQKKGEWFARDWIIAMLLFSGVMVLMYTVSADFLINNERNDLVDPAFSARYDRFQNSTSNIQRMFEATSGPSGLNPINFGELVLGSAFTVVTLVFSSVGVFNSQVSNIANDLGMPTVISVLVGPLIIGVVTVMIIFIVITSMTSRNKI